MTGLEVNDLHVKGIKSNVNKWINSINLVIFLERKKNMLGESIQLPFVIVRDKSKEK